MSRLGILGATALSLSLAVATPALAQQHMRQGGGVHVSGGSNFSGMRTGGATFNAGSNFRGSNASIAAPNRATVATPGVAGANVATTASGGRFADRDFRRGDFRDRRFGAGAGFVAGVAAGSALGYGYGYGYDPYWYGDDYAYSDGGYYDPGYVVSDPGYVVSQTAVPDASWCAAHYRSYDPASGTYLGFDGLRHPCP